MGRLHLDHPALAGVAPFGVIYAVSALAAGLSPAQTLAMSLLIFAGASQFTAVGMFAAAAGPAAIVVTTLIIDARHLLLSASLAPYLRRLGLWGRLGLAAQLTDESYAMGVRQFFSGRGSAAFQIGANLSVYVAWQCSTLAGVLLGRALPDPAAYGLDLVFPLTFIGLLVPLLAGLVGALVAWRTGNTLATIAAGMAAYWALRLGGVP